MVSSREFVGFQYQNDILDKATFESYMGPLVRWINAGETPRYYCDLFTLEIDSSFVACVQARLDPTA